MSRIGKAPVTIPDGVTVDIKKSVVKVKGPKGEVEQQVEPGLKVSVEARLMCTEISSENRQQHASPG